MQILPLKVIPKPEEGTRTVIQGTNDLRHQAYIRGKGDTSYTCGNCDHVILENVVAGQVRGIVFKCLSCGSYNDTNP